MIFIYVNTLSYHIINNSNCWFIIWVKIKMWIKPREEVIKFENTPVEVVPTRIVTTKIWDHIESNEIRGYFDEVVYMIINQLRIVKHEVVSIQRVF